MISTVGMPPNLAITLIQRERETFEKGIKTDPLSQREISSFKERIGDIKNVDDLMKDYQVFSFVMKSFGLESQINAKAMVKQILTSDPEDKKSLVARFTNTDFKAINAFMEFNTDGTVKPGKFDDPEFVDAMVDRYVGQRIISSQVEDNPVVGEALRFLKDVPTFTNWFKVLSNKGATNVMRVALGFPDALKGADVDAQERMFSKKMDIADLKDPKVVDSIVRKYVAIQSANQAALQPTGIMTLFNSSMNSGTWAPVTLDITNVSSMRTGYNRF